MHKSSAPSLWRRIKARNCLVGSKCNKCSSLFYPPKSVCKCGNDKLDELRFSGKGKIVSFSEIHTPPTNFEKQVPYTVALIKLEEGPMLTAQVVDSGKIYIGMEVESCLRKMYSNGKEGMLCYGTKFRPAR